MESISNNLQPTKRAAWIALLTGASVLFSFALACATPFPALATLAALHMRKRDAVALTAAAWLANQIIGYSFLHYPQTLDSFAWGGVIGVSALAAAVAAMASETLARRAGWAIAMLSAFFSAFIAYEGILYAATAVLPSEPSAFSMAIILRILEINALAFVGFLVLHAIGRTLRVAPSREIGAMTSAKVA
jgi:hypothetical protein